MKAYFFTEMPYPYVPEEVERAYGSSRVIIPNSYCDPVEMADLYNRYLDEYEYADELGLDLMLNEHHQTLTCLDAAISIPAAALARRTSKARIVLLGTPLPHRDNPVRVAEEIAMLDCISRGRITSGFVRGVPTEIHPSNTNPVLNRARFEEAHDLILKAWTTAEPFNWEGRFWQSRYVTACPRPYQQPHPPIWITGSSLDNVPWVADHNSLIDVYKRRCAEQGLAAPGADRFAYLALCHTAETDAQAEAEGQQLLWYLRRLRHPGFNAPPGYISPRVQARTMLGGPQKGYADSFETLQNNGIVMVGSPDTMIRRIRTLYERCGIGHLLMMNQAGAMPDYQVRRSLELFSREVYPAIRDLGVSVTTAPGLGSVRGVPAL